MNRDRRLLVSYRTLGLGDLLTAVPALRGLRRAYPGHEHVLVTSGWLDPIVERIEAVERMVAADELAPLPVELAQPDVAVNLHGSGPQSHRAVLAAGPVRFIAFHHPEVVETADAPRWRDDEHEVTRWCRLLEAWDIEADPEDLHLDLGRGARHGPAVVHPGAKARSRRWPPERFGSVAAALRSRGYEVVVTGSTRERPLGLEVARHAGLGDDVVIAGRTGLGQLIDVLAAAPLVVCGDTGVAHLATALRTPSVVLFGPTSPAAWGPPVGLRHRHEVLWVGREGDPLGDEPDPGLLEIEVEDVVAAIDHLEATVG